MFGSFDDGFESKFTSRSQYEQDSSSVALGIIISTCIGASQISTVKFNITVESHPKTETVYSNIF